MRFVVPGCNPLNLKNTLNCFTFYSNLKLRFACLVLFSILALGLHAQSVYELNTGWTCAPIGNVKESGTAISQRSFGTSGWMPATVPGTVLTTLLNNKRVPDPFYGMNNEHIKDIYTTGPEYYTYWFVKDFQEVQPSAGNQVYLNFRGVNYRCEIFLNGKKVNAQTHTGMFLR